MHTMIDNQVDIAYIYPILMRLILASETGHSINSSNYISIKQCYRHKHEVLMPTIFLPLLSAAGYLLQISYKFLPHYLAANYLEYDQYNLEEGLLQKIKQDPQWYYRHIYPTILDWQMVDAMATKPVKVFSKIEVDSCHVSKKIFLYDHKCLKYPPYFGVDVNQIMKSDIDFNKYEKIYLVGGLAQENIKKLYTHIPESPIWGITPMLNKQLPYRYFLNAIKYFAGTIFSGNINIHLPFLMSYFQAGLSPISFYHAIYHLKKIDTVIMNALCLMHNNTPKYRLDYYLNYQRCASHTDLWMCDQSESKQNVNSYTDYLFLLSE